VVEIDSLDGDDYEMLIALKVEVVLVDNKMHA
jgi:hypothetical protein